MSSVSAALRHANDETNVGWAALACLSAVGCGGQAQREAGQETPDADVGPPPAGFYSLTVEHLSDSCGLAPTQSMQDYLVGANAKAVNLALAHTSGKRQDIEWDQPFVFTSTECGATITLDVTATTSRSFVVDSQIDWTSPKACTLFSPGVPSTDCSEHERETYELEEACPATRNRVSCGG